MVFDTDTLTDLILESAIKLQARYLSHQDGPVSRAQGLALPHSGHLTDHFQAVMLGVWYKSVIFTAEKKRACHTGELKQIYEALGFALNGAP